jgi:curli biogenesis system outer membrane secretion channel CsgG
MKWASLSLVSLVGFIFNGFGCAGVPLVTFAQGADLTEQTKAAVLPFTEAAEPRAYSVVVGSGTPPQSGEIVSSMVSEALLESGAYRVIERSKLKSILDEMDLSLTELVDKKGYKEVGRLLGTDVLIVGNVSRYYQTGGLWFFAEVSFSARCVDVQTGEVLWSASPAVSDFGTVQDHTKNMCRKVAGELKARRDKQLSPKGRNP